MIKGKSRHAWQSLHFSDVDLGCRFCNCSLRGHGTLTKAVLEEHKDKERNAATQSLAQKASGDVWGRAPGTGQSVVCLLYTSDAADDPEIV